MRRDSSFTLRGALEILGHRESRLIDKLDKALGGVILTAGAAAGLAAVGAPLGPVALWAAIFGWIEQKNAALELARDVVNSVAGKLDEVSELERRQIICSAHAMIVAASFFAAFQENGGADFRDRIKLDDNEIATVISGRWRGAAASLFEALYDLDVPTPSPAIGFEENVDKVTSWMSHSGEKLHGFMSVLSIDGDIPIAWEKIVCDGTERYRANFFELSAKAPEFGIWALLGEGAATRSVIRQTNEDLARALDHNRDALARVEAMLRVTSSSRGTVTDLRSVLELANRGILEESIVRTGESHYGPDLTFPTVGRIYINPRYRAMRMGDASRPAEGHWWEKFPSRADFDEMLTGFIISPESTRYPMLLLGDPGAGKSMLTKILAARLPGETYAVVRVPLRHVAATAPIRVQIQQALDEQTNGRADWAQLSEQSAEAIRVVMLDGLDELLQASASDRSGYLQEVLDFQAVEARQGQPVVVIVTSRIVVADRVNIPYGSTVVKLDAFTEEDIREWLDRWQEWNTEAIDAGKIRPLTLEAALRHEELARQPLLLLILAIYSAAPERPALDTDISTADLYERLLREFADREVRKGFPHGVGKAELERLVQDHLDRLAILALGMFNRGRQDISEEDLRSDLAVLDKRLTERSQVAKEGERIIAGFYVHVAEARSLALAEEAQSLAKQIMRGVYPQRSYEFMHATFGEYLVVSRIVVELVDMAEKVFAGRRGISDPEDGLLFAILSHQALVARQSTIKFAAEIGASLSVDDRNKVLAVIELLINSCRCREDSSRYAVYRPTSQDSIRQLAHYSANLVSLRVALGPSGSGVPLGRLFRASNDVECLQRWQSMVWTWKAGLDSAGIKALLAMLFLSREHLTVDISGDADISSEAHFRSAMTDSGLAFARLLGDHDTEVRARYVAALVDNYHYGSYSANDWVHQISCFLIPAIAGRPVEPGCVLPSLPPAGISRRDANRVAALIFNYLRTGRLSNAISKGLLRILFALPEVSEYDEYALARAIMVNPDLTLEVQELQDAKLYGALHDYIRLVSLPVYIDDPGGVSSEDGRSSEEWMEMIRNIIEIYSATAVWR